MKRIGVLVLSRPTLQGTFGMVAASDWFAATTGMGMLETGGNAFDAAIAAGFVLQVVEPYMCGPGGEMVALFADRSDRKPTVLCGQGPAPKGATPDHFGRLGLDAVPGSGVLAAPVPGAFDAWMLLLRDHGTKSLREVLSPAINYAENGHPLLPGTSRSIRRNESRFKTYWPSSASLYLARGKRPMPYSLHRNEALAATYRRVLSEAEAAAGQREGQIEAARRTWYQGFVAEAIHEFARQPHFDAEGRQYPGVISADDLACYQSGYEEPASLDWRGWTICKPGPWSQGPVQLQQLALLDGLDATAHGHDSAQRIHLLAETAKLAYADRDAYYGDVPDVPLSALLSPGYTRERCRLVGPDASYELRPGRVGQRAPRLPPAVATDDRPLASGDTCHIDAVDRKGNMISVTPSGGFLENSPVIGSLGFPLGTRLEMTRLEEELPNTLRPGRRPRTTITPTMVTRLGEPVLSFGSPGADLQEQWSLQFFLGFSSGLEAQQAVEAPRCHTTHLISSFVPHQAELGRLVVEPQIADQTVAELRDRGHDVKVVNPYYRRLGGMGRVTVVGRDPATGRLFGAADPRAEQDYVCGR
jgi:gamma-glutamyltranspeptidase/glutathione hydrolase